MITPNTYIIDPFFLQNVSLLSNTTKRIMMLMPKPTIVFTCIIDTNNVGHTSVGSHPYKDPQPVQLNMP